MEAPAAARIAIDATPLLGPVTGVGTMVRELATRLPAALAASTGPPVDLGGYVVSVRGRRDLTDALPAGLEPILTPIPARLAHRAWRSLDRPRVCADRDLVHGTNYVVPPGPGARLVTVHDLTAWRYPELVDRHSRHYPALVARAIDCGAHVHVVSDHVRQEVVSDLRVPADRVHLVRNGFTPGPVGDADAGRTQIGRPYVLALGTIEPRKDHVTLVRAIARLVDRFDDLVLALVGPPGWGSEQLDREIEALGLSTRVRRLGWVDAGRKADLLAGAELLAFPSRYEGFGLPVLEAMGAGVPVVSTVAGAIPEVAGDAAELVPPGDPDVLAEAVATVLEDEQTRARLVAAGRQRVRQFPWDRSAAALARLYRQLTGERAEVATG
ncbi:MAG: glycosyltransferase family 1 protein [Actinomycetota bacterium]